jgi:hypothetical protein
MKRFMTKFALLFAVAMLSCVSKEQHKKAVDGALSLGKKEGRAAVLDSLKRYKVERQVGLDTLSDYLSKNKQTWMSIASIKDSLCSCSELAKKHLTGQGHVHNGGTTKAASGAAREVGFMVITKDADPDPNKDHKKVCYVPFVSKNPLKPCDHLEKINGFEVLCVPIYDVAGQLLYELPIAYNLKKGSPHNHKPEVCY